MTKVIYAIIAIAIVIFAVSKFSLLDDLYNSGKMKKGVQDQIKSDWIDGSLQITRINVNKVKPSNWVLVDKATKTYTCDMKIIGNYTLNYGDQSKTTPFEITKKMEVVKSEPYTIRRVGY
ncbi:MAG: hypothetical protein CVU48_06295 [Candidatus Cloacimonetes bacterium HGW-Cloacimonetes-1]|jgi:hypothetical protein|nr:MAG: hypothetical protein CVU48_06295 [Candidatus Cloacimonetes bacterium HGW-Cloacimonetes-1]